MKTRKVVEREFTDCWDLVKAHGMELNKLSFIRHEKTWITVMQRSKLLVSSYIAMLLYPFTAKYLKLKLFDDLTIAYTTRCPQFNSWLIENLGFTSVIFILSK